MTIFCRRLSGLPATSGSDSDDDMSDIGPNLANPKEIKYQVVDTTKNGILFNPEAPRPTELLAAANHE